MPCFACHVQILAPMKLVQCCKVKGLNLIRKLQERRAPIYRLNPELIQDLARNFLEPFEAALLALCSKKFCHLIGTRYWQICHENSEQRNKLLFVWEREFSEKVHCVPCAKLHRATSTPYVNKNWNCQSLERRIRPSHLPDDRMKFIYIQAALMRHRLGLDTKQYIKALSYEHHSPLTYTTTKRYYALSEARIVSGELLVRMQDWHFYPAEILTVGFPCDVDYTIYLGCYHNWDGSATRQVKEMLRYSSFEWESLNRPDNYGGLRQCRFCDTEFQFNIIPFLDLASKRPESPRLHDRYVATVRTTWANFGDGSPDWNGKYRRQFMAEWLPPLTGLRQPVHNPVVFKPGSIRDAFENGKEFCFESVVSKQMKRALKRVLIENDERLARMGNIKFVNRFRNY